MFKGRLSVPVQVCDEEAQRLVVGGGQLAEQVPDLKDDSVELDAGPSLLGGLGGGSDRLRLLHQHPLALLGQADEVVVVSVEDEGLWELPGGERGSLYGQLSATCVAPRFQWFWDFCSLLPIAQLWLS